jgi:hypothetical protein
MRRAAVASLLSISCADNVQGEIRIGKVDVFAPHDCVDGTELGFDGVEMWDDEGRYAHLVRFAQEPALVFYEGGGETFRVAPLDCRRFEGTLERTPWGTRRGEIDLQCSASVGSVEGSLRFRRCGSLDDTDDDDGWDDDDWDDDDC